MMRVWIAAASLLWLAMLPAHAQLTYVQPGCGTTPPPPAVTWGLTHPIVCINDFSKAGAIDTTATNVEGNVLSLFQPCTYPWPRTWNGTPQFPCATSADLQITGGQVKLAPTGGNVGGLIELSNCGYNKNNTNFVTNAWTPPYYVEVNASFGPCISCTGGQTPAIWMWGIGQNYPWPSFPTGIWSTELDIIDTPTAAGDVAVWAWGNGQGPGTSPFFTHNWPYGSFPTATWWGAVILDAATYNNGGLMAAQVYNGNTENGVVQQGTSGVGSDGNNIQLLPADHTDQQIQCLNLQGDGLVISKIAVWGKPIPNGFTRIH